MHCCVRCAILHAFDQSERKVVGEPKPSNTHKSIKICVGETTASFVFAVMRLERIANFPDQADVQEITSRISGNAAAAMRYDIHDICAHSAVAIRYFTISVRKRGCDTIFHGIFANL